MDFTPDYSTMSEKDLIIIESVADGIIKSKEVEKK